MLSTLGRSIILQVMARMRAIVLTVDVLYTNAALPLISDLAFITDDDGKMLKNAP